MVKHTKLLRNPDKIFVKSEKDFVDLPYNLDFYTKFKNNLK